MSVLSQNAHWSEYFFDSKRQGRLVSQFLMTIYAKTVGVWDNNKDLVQGHSFHISDSSARCLLLCTFIHLRRRQFSALSTWLPFPQISTDSIASSCACSQSSHHLGRKVSSEAKRVRDFSRLRRNCRYVSLISGSDPSKYSTLLWRLHLKSSGKTGRH